MTDFVPEHIRPAVQGLVDQIKELCLIATGGPVTVTIAPFVPQEITEARIREYICEKTGCSWSNIKSPVRDREVVAARHTYAYLVKMYVGSTAAEIGQSLGKRDHTTVLAAIQRVKDYLETRDPIICNIIYSFNPEQ